MQELHQHAASSMSPNCSEPFVQEFWQLDLLEKASARLISLPYLSQKQSFEGRAVTCHNQTLLRKISHPVPQSVTCFLTSLLKASLIAQLLFA